MVSAYTPSLGRAGHRSQTGYALKLVAGPAPDSVGTMGATERAAVTRASSVMTAPIPASSTFRLPDGIAHQIEPTSAVEARVEAQDVGEAVVRRKHRQIVGTRLPRGAELKTRFHNHGT